MQLKDYQISTIEHMLEHKRCLIDADTGAGKTVITLTALARLANEGKIKCVLITAPVNALASWKRASMPDGKGGRLEIDVIKTFKKKWNVDIEIVSLPSVWRGKLKHSDFYIEEVTTNKGTHYEIRGTQHRYDCIIIDESHNIKNHQAIQTQFLLEISRDMFDKRTKQRVVKAPEYKYCLTATPQGDTRYDLWAQMEFLQKGTFPAVTNFTDTFCILNDYYKPTRNKVGAHLDKMLMEMMGNRYILIPRNITDAYKPKVNKDIVIRVDKTAEILEIEKKVKQELITLYAGKSSSNIMHEAAILFNVYMGYSGELDKLIPSNKYNELVRLVDTLPRPLIIFTNYNAEREIVERMLTAKNVAYKSIHGGINNTQRASIKEEYNSGKLDVLVCNLAAGNAGLDLYGGNTSVFVGINPSFIKDYQGKGRTARTGSKHSEVNYYYLITKGTLEARFYDLLRDKKATATELRNMLLEYLRE